MMLFLAQILGGNVACSALRHLSPRAFTDSAYCQARRRVPLAFFEQLLTAVTRSMLDAADDAPGRWFGHEMSVPPFATAGGIGRRLCFPQLASSARGPRVGDNVATRSAAAMAASAGEERSTTWPHPAPTASERG
jgi:hypothetical protein